MHLCADDGTIGQADAAARAGLARSTALLIGKGDLGRTQAQILRYLETAAPGLTLLNLPQEVDLSLAALDNALSGFAAFTP